MVTKLKIIVLYDSVDSKWCAVLHTTNVRLFCCLINRSSVVFVFEVKIESVRFLDATTDLPKSISILSITRFAVRVRTKCARTPAV